MTPGAIKEATRRALSPIEQVRPVDVAALMVSGATWAYVEDRDGDRLVFEVWLEGTRVRIPVGPESITATARFLAAAVTVATGGV